MNYAIVGHGRMGRAIEQEAAGRGHQMVASVGSEMGKVPDRSLAGAEVAFEFSVPDAAEQNIRRILEARIPVVCGTTGWEPSADLHALALEARVGLIVAANFSIGVQLFYRLVAEATRVLGSVGLHEPFVLERHHRGKNDVPSGTARRLAAIVVEHEPRLHSVQEGNPEGRLAPGVLQVASIRAGAEPGEHEVGFDGAHDLISLQHRARSRAGFALGAVIAAEWLIEAPPGRQQLDCVLNDLIARGIVSGQDRKQGGSP